MPRTAKELSSLKNLGSGAGAIPRGYDPGVLETFANGNPGRDYWVSFTCPEFTTLCPKTGQPDFAEIRIKYIPAAKLVESKSLKLYLFGFRNRGDFHEDVVNTIHDDLKALMEPKYIEVCGKFAARGGITIDPFVNSGSDGRWRAFAAERFAAWRGVRG